MKNSGNIIVIKEEVDDDLWITIGLFGKKNHKIAYDSILNEFEGRYSSEFLQNRFIREKISADEFKHQGDQNYYFEGKLFNLNPRVFKVYLDEKTIRVR